MALVKRFAVLFLAGMLFFGGTSRAADPPSEYAVKAAFLVKFADYVDWPPDPSAASRPFVVAVLGPDPFGDMLDRIVANKRVHGRRLVARRVTTADEAASADIVFISARDEKDLNRSLRALEGRPILTVGELDGFAASGGMIGFRLQDNTVRFDINVEPATRARLKLSSQLLKLARIVKGGAA